MITYLYNKISVKLRKSELRDEWYLYLEAYPVFKVGYDKPQRERKYLNRIITTPMWDKSRPARLNANGEQSYKPKCDQNGIITAQKQSHYRIKQNKRVLLSPSEN